jgi:DNA polymerase-3 subunit delta'
VFETILGNEPLKAYLRTALEQNRLPQTLLFAGPDGIGKSLFARAIASHLLGSDRSPDLHLLAPEGKSGLYAIDTLREMMDKEHAAPFEASRKVFILSDAERMQPASANALLKTLEEPTPETLFILLSSAPQTLLPTILSRCVLLAFQPLQEEAIATLLEAKGHPRHLAKWAHGSAGRAFELAEHPEMEEQRQILFRLLAAPPSYPEMTKQLELLEKLIEEGKEEDPVRASRRADHLFASVLMWHRDQLLRELGGGRELLFFPDQIGTPHPLSTIEQKIEKARMAYQRNMKLSHCLQSCLHEFAGPGKLGA